MKVYLNYLIFAELMITIFVVFSSTTQAKNKNPYKNMIQYFVCQRDFDKRPIWVEEIKPKGCKLWYSKYSKGGAAAWSEVSTDHCLNISEKIRKNLESVNFKCVEKPKISI